MIDGDKIVAVEYVIPSSIQEEMAQKISENIRQYYFQNVAQGVSEKVLKALEDDGFVNRVSAAVVERIKISEDDFINGVSHEIKDALIKVTGVLSSEVLKKVEDKIKSYGFINIGR